MRRGNFVPHNSEPRIKVATARSADVVTLESAPFETDDGRGIADRIRTLLDHAGTVVAYLVYWGAAGAWAGLWLLVAGLHLRQGDWIGGVLSGAIGIAPLLFVGAGSIRRLTDRRPTAVLPPG